MSRVAFFTFGIVREAWGHPALADFESMRAPLWTEVQGAEGFVGHGMDARDWPPTRFAPAERSTMTITLWRDLSSVFSFAYRAPWHTEALRRRKAWFLDTKWPTYAAWWVDDEVVPTPSEAIQRLEYLHDHGSTPYAFDFKTPFDVAGTPLGALAEGRTSRMDTVTEAPCEYTAHPEPTVPGAS